MAEDGKSDAKEDITKADGTEDITEKEISNLKCRMQYLRENFTKAANKLGTLIDAG